MRIGDGHPQAQQMAFLGFIFKILKIGPRMDDCVIIEQLYVALLDVHGEAELRVWQQFIEIIQHFYLRVS